MICFQMCSSTEHEIVDKLIDGEKKLCGQIDKSILLGWFVTINLLQIFPLCFINQLIKQPIKPAINRFIDQSINQSITPNQLISRSFMLSINFFFLDI